MLCSRTPLRTNRPGTDFNGTDGWIIRKNDIIQREIRNCPPLISITFFLLKAKTRNMIMRIWVRTTKERTGLEAKRG